MEKKEIKKVVREGYGKIAKGGGSCCGPSNTQSWPADLADDTNLSLGCGNPVALASLKEGEVVLDLGSGAGFDCFLAAKKVGERGKVIGVDMTPEMVEKARKNADKGNYKNVEFRLGEIENLPAADNSVDGLSCWSDHERRISESYRSSRIRGCEGG